jgi:hypothetical protein
MQVKGLFRRCQFGVHYDYTKTVQWNAESVYRERIAVMLYRQQMQGRIAITQPMHAWVSGQLARVWGNERFGEMVPFEEVCLGAVGLH